MSPYLTAEVSDRLMQQILNVFNRERLTAQQARLILSRVRDLKPK